MASTGMIIWALIGLAGMLSGILTVGAARRRSRLTEQAVAPASADRAPQATPAAEAEPVPQGSLTQAA